MSGTTSVGDHTVARVLRSFVVVGFDTEVTVSGLPAGSVRAVGPVSRVADLVTAANEARGDYFAVQRAPLPPSWLVDAAALIEQDPRVGAVVVVGRDTAPDADVFAEAGPGLVVPVRLLHAVGGLHATTSDSPGLGAEPDLQWRLAARGYRVAALPIAAAGSFPRRLPLSTRLNVLVDNLEPETLGRALPALVLAAVTSPLRAHAVATETLDLQRSPGHDDVGTVPVPAESLAGAHEIVDFSKALPLVSVHRTQTQLARRLSDRAMASQIVPYLVATAEQAGVTAEIAAGFPGGLRLETALRTLVLVDGSAEDTDGWLGDLRRSLGGEVTVLAASDATSTDGDRADVILLAGVQLRSVPWAAPLAVPVAVDLSRSDLQSELESEPPGLVRGSERVGRRAELLIETLARADLVVVRDEDQRDVALGLLAGAGRLNDLVYDEDASLRSLVDVLDAQHLATWCARPRRAVDLVRTFLAPDTVGAPSTGRVRQLSGTLRRAIGRGAS